MEAVSAFCIGGSAEVAVQETHHRRNMGSRCGSVKDWGHGGVHGEDVAVAASLLPQFDFEEIVPRDFGALLVGRCEKTCGLVEKYFRPMTR